MSREKKIWIFDMDGVVLDSEPLHDQARDQMYKKYDIPYDDSFPDPVGKSSRLFWKMVAEKYGRIWDDIKMEQEQFLRVAELVEENHVPVTKGLTEVLEWIRAEGFKTGLASSSDRMLVDRVLRALGVIEYFDIIVTGDEVAEKKPSPDVYEKVLKVAGVRCEDAFAVEDSTAGVEAAKRAGIYCYGYRNVTSGEQDLSRSDRIIDDLRDMIDLYTESRNLTD